MRRANRLVTLALLATAVLCSSAGICMMDALAAAPRAASHRHACCASAKRTVIVASDATCCSMPNAGFVNVLRFTLQAQPANATFDCSLAAAVPVRFTAFSAVTIRPPLVLRI